MNKFVESEYDQFKKKTVVELKDAIALDVKSTGHSMFVTDVTASFRKVAIEGEFEDFLMDAQLISESGFGLSNGQMQMIVDGKHFNFDGHENFSQPHLDTFHIESAFYKLTLEELKTICDASSINVRLTNGDDFIDLPKTDKLQWAARVLYNAVIDNTAYVSQILEVNNQEEHKQYVEKHKSGLIWTIVLSVIAIVIGIICPAWWLVVIGIAAIGIHVSVFCGKKNQILNSETLE